MVSLTCKRENALSKPPPLAVLSAIAPLSVFASKFVFTIFSLGYLILIIIAFQKKKCNNFDHCLQILSQKQMAHLIFGKCGLLQLLVIYFLFK